MSELICRFAQGLFGMRGLILAGGESSRMGTDKAFLEIAGVPFWQQSVRLLQTFTSEIVISCHPENFDTIDWPDKTKDQAAYAGHGPISGILSAMELYPGPWLLLACDYPLLTAEDIRFLLSHRDTEAVATVFQHPESGFAEPLIGIYESGFLPLLKNYFASGKDSMQKLLRSPAALELINFITPPDPGHLLSFDTPEIFRQYYPNP